MLSMLVINLTLTLYAQHAYHATPLSPTLVLFAVGVCQFNQAFGYTDAVPYCRLLIQERDTEQEHNDIDLKGVCWRLELR